jgi:hypothetical protein
MLAVLYASRLRLSRLRIVCDPAAGQEKESYTTATSRARVVVCAWCKARPARALPILTHRQAFQLESVVYRDNTIDLSIRMLRRISLAS